MSPKPTFERLFGYFIFSGIGGLEAHTARHNSLSLFHVVSPFIGLWPLMGRLPLLPPNALRLQDGVFLFKGRVCWRASRLKVGERFLWTIGTLGF